MVREKDGQRKGKIEGGMGRGQDEHRRGGQGRDGQREG